MMIGGNQPYFIPYIGYWQLINAVDVFVLGDDYNYIERGWINRNRLLESGQNKFFNIEISHASSNKKINELFLSERYDRAEKLARLDRIYGKAPYFEEGYMLMDQVLSSEERNLARFLDQSIRKICDYLGIHTKIMNSSEIPHNSELKREYRIFDMCRYMGADVCINANGGQKLYTFEQFREQGIKLRFIQPEIKPYKQFSDELVPGLSILDVIMFNSKEEIQKMLQKYTVLWEEGSTSACL